MRVNRATASGNGVGGFSAKGSSSIHAVNAVATGNGEAGFKAENLSHIYAVGSTSTGNQTAYSPTPDMLSGNGSYINTLD